MTCSFPRCDVATSQDYQTYDLAIKLRDFLTTELNDVAPKIVLNKLHRRFLDPNRESEEATFNEPIPLQAYNEYHAAVSEAILNMPMPALHLDIHGYSDGSVDPVNWVMFGKLLYHF